MDVENRYLRPRGVHVHIEIGEGRDSLAVHDGHILGADGHEVLEAHVGVVRVEIQQRFLTRVPVDAGLAVGREPGVEAGTGDYNVLGLSHHDRPGLITSVKFVACGT